MVRTGLDEEELDEDDDCPERTQAGDGLRSSETNTGTGSGSGVPSEAFGLPQMGGLDDMAGLADGLSAEDLEVMQELTGNPPEAMHAALSAMQVTINLNG